MFFDMQQTTALEGVIAFPDWPFANLPRQPPIDERDFVVGDQGGTTFYVEGSLGG